MMATTATMNSPAGTEPNTNSVTTSLSQKNKKAGKLKPPPQPGAPLEGKTSSTSSSASEGGGGKGRTMRQVSTQQSMRGEKERKIGHRRVTEGGQVTYKKVESSQLMGAIQLGIQHAVGGLSAKPERDVLMQDFTVVETVVFPEYGGSVTPAHKFGEFRFKTYAPVAFRYFRELFGIQTEDFLMSLCDDSLRELSNPGASGSIFYITDDDEFILKTVQHKEAGFLQKLLPGYYMNLNQNPRTCLPKFFGLYCYQSMGKNIRILVMNNLLPSTIKMHQKYDLKGSTYKRKASKHERSKGSPTLKDLDFVEDHPDAILLEADTYKALMNTIQRDCLVLESFKIMDYSLLVGIHNLDEAARERKEFEDQQPQEDTGDNQQPVYATAGSSSRTGSTKSAAGLGRTKSINRHKLSAFTTTMESIQAQADPVDLDTDERIPPGGIPARNSRGERLILYLGIIDILQCYKVTKKLEHTFKAFIHDGDSVSVCHPSFYAQRFQSFLKSNVFRKIPSPLKHSPSKRKSGSSSGGGGAGRGARLTSEGGESNTSAAGVGMRVDHMAASMQSAGHVHYTAAGSGGGGRDLSIGGSKARPDLLPTSSTPPPPFSEVDQQPPQSAGSGKQVTFADSHRGPPQQPAGATTSTITSGGGTLAAAAAAAATSTVETPPSQSPLRPGSDQGLDLSEVVLEAEEDEQTRL